MLEEDGLVLAAVLAHQTARRCIVRPCAFAGVARIRRETRTFEPFVGERRSARDADLAAAEALEGEVPLLLRRVARRAREARPGQQCASVRSSAVVHPPGEDEDNVTGVGFAACEGHNQRVAVGVLRELGDELYEVVGRGEEVGLHDLDTRSDEVPGLDEGARFEAVDDWADGQLEELAEAVGASGVAVTPKRYFAGRRRRTSR